MAVCSPLYETFDTHFGDMKQKTWSMRNFLNRLWYRCDQPLIAQCPGSWHAVLQHIEISATHTSLENDPILFCCNDAGFRLHVTAFLSEMSFAVLQAALYCLHDLCGRTAAM